MFTTKLEEELFSDIERFSPLAIAIQHALLALAVLYRLLNQEADGKLKDLKPLCQAFEAVVLSLGPMKAKIGACDPYHFPAMAFMEFSQALHYVMRLVRKLLPSFVSDDPILGLLHKLEEMVRQAKLG